MIEYKGKYATGKILIDSFESNVVSQLYNILNNPAFENENIVVMPDCHIGKGVMVGFTSTLTNYICPGVIGPDMGCGVTAYNLGKLKSAKTEKLDKFIRNRIPIGPNIHDKSLIEPEFLNEIISRLDLNYSDTMCGLGTMGSGNHFIEVAKADNNDIWLVIHSGSRHFGFEVSKYHINKAKENMKKIYSASAYSGLEYLSLDSEDGQQYIKDLQIAQQYAKLNRELMAKVIIEEFFKKRINECEKVESIHNYINLNDNIIRKGSISAHPGEKIIIPFNMQFGSMIATGKSTKENNYSAPHGAGRIMNRSDAKGKVSLDAYQKSMKGIFTTSVNKSTISESPQAYKRPKVILENISDLVDINFFIKPIYNIKAGD